MRYVVTINNKSYEVAVEKGQANILQSLKPSPLLLQQQCRLAVNRLNRLCLVPYWM